MDRCRTAALLALVLAGCDAPPPQLPVDHAPDTPRRSSLHGPAYTLSGRVVWDGQPPALAQVNALRPKSGGGIIALSRPHPNVPRIDPATHGLAGAVVTLRGIDPSNAKPWDHPPVTIELHDERPLVRQGDAPPVNVGFVRRGDVVTMVSRQDRFHILRARGAAFWSLTFPDADRSRTRRLAAEGRVDLTSAAGDYWMHAYLFVSDHPYWTRTAADGRWELRDVPAGDYQVVVWLPSWRVTKVERDPESGGVSRWTMAAGPEKGYSVTVGSSDVSVPDFIFRD
ncbi:MAG TPA: hypothetical protein VL371_13860 [Gemmataceae bacterium]|nr:hypothetical protein [Gemmataceae bacterium]